MRGTFRIGQFLRRQFWIAALAALLIPLWGCASLPEDGGTGEQKPQIRTMQFDESACSDAINWYGRIHHDGEKKEVLFSNAASGFEFSFTGTKVTAKIRAAESPFPKEAAGVGYLYVYLDGETNYNRAARVQLEAGEKEYVLAEVSRGPHRVRVLKATEAKYGEAALSELTCEGAFGAPPARPALRAELIGDSIMAGSESMRESTTADSKLLASENAMASYGYVAAGDVIGAEISSVVRSGGLVSGYKGYASVPDYYGVTDCNSMAEYDRAAFAPDLFIVDLGTNDVLLGAPQTLIRDKYEEFLARIRADFPEVPVFVCSGGMVTGMDALVKSMTDSLRSAGDGNVYCFKLPQMSVAGHPREIMQQTNGYSLGAFIVETLGLELI